MYSGLSTKEIPERKRSNYSICLLCTLPLMLALMVGAFTIDGSFIQDDKSAIVRNPLVVREGITLSEFFQHDSWGFLSNGKVMIWRPLLPMIWRVFWAIDPGNPLIFRLLTVMLHLMATGMVLLIAHYLLRDRQIAWAAAVLFAVHPVHAEAVGEIVGQADILAVLLGMLAVYIALVRNDHAGTPLLVSLLLIAACLAKESAVVFSAIIAVSALLPAGVPLRKRLAVSICAALVAVLNVVFQLSLERVEGNPLDNLAFASQGSQRILHSLYVIGRAITMCFVPIGMSPFHDYAAVDLSLSTLLPHAIPGALFLCIGMIVFFLSLKKRSIAGIIGTGLLFGPVIINSSLIVRVGTELAERLLYPASIAACAIIAFMIYRVIRPRFALVLIVLLALIFTVQSWSAQRPWRNQLDLYAHGAESEPLSARLHLYYGMNLLANKDVYAAAWHFMATTYIMKDFPNRVDPMPIYQLEQMPIEQRILEGPAVFDPENPCRYLHGYLQFLDRKTPHLAMHMRKLLTDRYSECASGSPSGQTPSAKPET